MRRDGRPHHHQKQLAALFSPGPHKANPRAWLWLQTGLKLRKGCEEKSAQAWALRGGGGREPRGRSAQSHPILLASWVAALPLGHHSPKPSLGWGKLQNLLGWGGTAGVGHQAQSGEGGCVFQVYSSRAQGHQDTKWGCESRSGCPPSALPICCTSHSAPCTGTLWLLRRV